MFADQYSCHTIHHLITCILTETSVREHHKIAVVYVGPGQDDRDVILNNTSGSVQYEEFVRAIGWEISLATHKGYNGGLKHSHGKKRKGEEIE